MGRTSTATTAVTLLVVALAACGDDDAGAPTTAPSAPAAATEPSGAASTSTATTMPDRPDRSLPSGRLPETVPHTSVSPPVTGEVPTALLDEIFADAVDRTGVPPAAVVTVRAQAMTWPDGSLGCPEPGVVYTQALVAGYWVELDADGTLLDYRVGRNDVFTLCEDAPAIRRP